MPLMAILHACAIADTTEWGKTHSQLVSHWFVFVFSIVHEDLSVVPCGALVGKGWNLPLFLRVVLVLPHSCDQ